MKIMFFIVTLAGVVFLQPLAFASSVCELFLSSNVLHNQGLEMVVKEGSGKFDSALAMNISYEPIRFLREQIAKESGRTLDFFKQWNSNGEAHITVITPVEYFHVLTGGDSSRPIVSMSEIAEIAKRKAIQNSDLMVLGIGRGQAEIGGKIEETFFVIVESVNLRMIRQSIYDLFVQKGGNPAAWNPQRYFPHITIGYSKRDLHEVDGVFKNMENSYESRYRVNFESLQ